MDLQEAAFENSSNWVNKILMAVLFGLVIFVLPWVFIGLWRLPKLTFRAICFICRMTARAVKNITDRYGWVRFILGIVGLFPLTLAILLFRHSLFNDLSAQGVFPLVLCVLSVVGCACIALGIVKDNPEQEDEEETPRARTARRVAPVIDWTDEDERINGFVFGTTKK